MRIRQVKPAFWTDAKVAKLSYPTRLFYIGLWCIADDAGWLAWDPEQVGAELFPYETPGRRLRHVERWCGELVEAGRLVIHDCGCAVMATMPTHQRISGKQSFGARDRHQRHVVKHEVAERGSQVLSDSPGRVGNGKGRERNGTVGNGSARDQDRPEETEFQRKVPRPTVVGVR